MDKPQLIEILSREQKKLEDGGVEWLGKYSKARDLGFTFYMICQVLIKIGCSLSTRVQHEITKFMKENGIHFNKKKWNPVDFFNKEWSQNHSFDPFYAEVLTRDRRDVWRMWIAEPYVDSIQQFFDHHVSRPDSPLGEPEMSGITGLGDDLFWNPPEKMEEALDLLLNKRQIIFYGLPGTGKTYVARKLATYLMNGGEPVFLQFHPSYSYEDFFEGYRPVPNDDGGVPQFRLIPGPLKELAENANRNRDKNFVLVIDEINRGNLAKILGELYFLLEYRDEAIRLQYGGPPFGLPNNLLIIGTMNTADRSISHIDVALRRRFHFFALFPDRPPIEGLLRRYLKVKHPEMVWVADCVDEANQKLKLDGRDGLIGHSYFMRDDLGKSINLIWNYSIMPLIEERFVDQEHRIREFELEALRHESRETCA